MKTAIRLLIMSLVYAALGFASYARAQQTTQVKTETATLAAGCFWGVEAYYKKIPGVLETQVGYTGGHKDNPVYKDMSSGKTGHAEAIEIKFDPSIVTYETLLEHFYKFHDPTTPNRQGNDVGIQYRSAVFYQNEKQKKIAEDFKQLVEKSKAWKAPIVTEVTQAKKFWPAEEYHQDYLVKNPKGYDNHYVRDISFGRVPAKK